MNKLIDMYAAYCKWLWSFKAYRIITYVGTAATLAFYIYLWCIQTKEI